MIRSEETAGACISVGKPAFSDNMRPTDFPPDGERRNG